MLDQAPAAWHESPAFLEGGGEMGQRMRAFDWASSPLGPPQHWPAALRTTLRIMLSTRHPTFLFWGPQLLCFYNDAYSRSLGPERHPAILGQPGEPAWAEIWDLVGPQLAHVMGGHGATWHENQLIPTTRHGQREPLYWTYSCGPVDDDSTSGGIGGVLVLCTETSPQSLELLRFRADRQRWQDLFSQAPGFICVLVGAEHRFEYVNQRYQELVGQRAVLDRPVIECLPEAAPQGFIALLDGVRHSGQAYVAGGVPMQMHIGNARPVTRHMDFVYQPIRDATGEVSGIFVEGHDVTERLLSSQRLQAVLDSITDGFITFDPQLQLTYLNQAAERMLEQPAAALLGQPPAALTALMAAPDGRLLQAEIGQAAEGSTRNGEHWFDALEKWLHIRCCPRTGGGVVLYLQDVTDSRSAAQVALELQQQLRERAEELEAVMHNLPAYLWMAHDAACRRITGNPQAAALLNTGTDANMSASSLQAGERPFQEMINGRPAQAHELPLQRAASSGQPVPLTELQLVFDDGSRRELRGGAAPLFDAAGRVRGAVSAFVDITDLRQAQTQLQQREREMRTLADNTPDVLARFDRQHRHLFVNAAIERASGLRPEQVIGRTNSELGMPPELTAHWHQVVDEVFASGEQRQLEFVFPSPTGHRSFQARLVPERDEHEQVQQVLAIVQDVTVERHAQQAVRDAEQRKDEFLATLAHELRNPLAPLRTGLQVLERSKDVAAASAVRAMMNRQLEHMVRLIDDLMDVARISAGKLTLRREPVQLTAAVDMAVEASRTALQAGHHRLDLQLAAQPVWVNADLARLAQVLTNLLNNAAKYTPPGGQVTLALRRDGDEAVLSVTDNGIGIPPAMLDEVFQMFTQVDAALQREHGGLGVGLALARRIAVLHEGNIAAQSAGLGQGSVFTLRLPALPCAGADPGSAGVGAAAAAGQGRRVMVVDDNHDGADSLAMLLRLWGCEVRVAYGGAQALELLQGWTAELAFIDIGMPGMNGYTLAEALRRRGVQARLVALTGWGSAHDVQRSLEAGFSQHLTKPVSADAMQAVLAGG